MNKSIKIYVWKSKNLTNNCLKIGQTTKDVVEERIYESIGVLANSKEAEDIKILFKEELKDYKGNQITDKMIHNVLSNSGIKPQAKNGKKTELFDCSYEDFERAVQAVKDGFKRMSRYTKDFSMRPEQEKAVEITSKYFEEDERNTKFLWNAKMRFGKTFATYKLMEKMNFKKVLVLSFKVAVQEAWKNDLVQHRDFKDWDFLSKEEQNIDKAKKNKYVSFISFQDLLGKDEGGSFKKKNKAVFETNWDMIVLDEYHFGAWNDNSKYLYEAKELGLNSITKETKEKVYNSLSTKYHLCLSGTPFKALNSGEFLSEQIFNWTYTDEQRAKKNWDAKNGVNPYKSLPKITMFTYQLPKKMIDDINIAGDFNLNNFFKTKNNKLVNENAINNWLDFVSSKKDALKFKEETGKIPPLPFVDSDIADKINHTIWYFNSVETCNLMEKLLKKHIVFKNFNIVNIAGNVINSSSALEMVENAIENNDRTITITAGRLMAGVTVPKWSGIFMLNSCKAPETYFQSIFRVQSPCEEIGKETSYVFDFAPTRTLSQIIDLVQKDNTNPEKRTDEKLTELAEHLKINFFDGSNMAELSIEDIIEVGTSGSSSKLLAQRWKSTLLINLDNKTMTNILNNEKLKESLYNIEGFRSLGDNIVDVLVNKQNLVKEKEKQINIAKQKGDKSKVDKLTEEQIQAKKEMLEAKKKIQEKLLIFAARIPIFMYLTDHRETALMDVIKSLDSELFTRTTGLTLLDFDMLLDAGLFNKTLMNDSIYDFKKFEDNSFGYLGTNTHEDDYIGLWDTKIKKSQG